MTRTPQKPGLAFFTNARFAKIALCGVAAIALAGTTFITQSFTTIHLLAGLSLTAVVTYACYRIVKYVAPNTTIVKLASDIAMMMRSPSNLLIILTIAACQYFASITCIFAAADGDRAWAYAPAILLGFPLHHAFALMPHVWRPELLKVIAVFGNPIIWGVFFTWIFRGRGHAHLSDKANERS